MSAPQEIHDLIARFEQHVEAYKAATDTQIDRLVQDLYGLTEDEIAIVEGKAA